MQQIANIDIDFHSKQEIAYESEATEILYGGAAGGGKSFLMRSAAISWCTQIPGLQVYLFRRITKDLIKNHMEGPKGFRSMLAPWRQYQFVKIVENEIRFWNDAKIYLCHCQHENDMYDFDGAEIHVLLVDELTHFTEKIYRFLRGRVRAVGLPELPPGLKGRFPRIINGTNPGNIGHLWVKRCFIDGAQPFEIRRMDDEEGGMLRQFIPALLEDNPSMLQDDPTYEAKLKGLGSKALVEAKRYGNWDIIEGAYFDNWSHRNIIRPFAIPVHWTKFRSFDWGSAKPFSCGWYAVSDGLGHIPKGALVKYREWYGKVENKDDTGVKMTVEQVAKGILERDGKDDIIYSVADPAIFAQDGGPSMASRFAEKGIYFRRAKNKRVSKEGVVGGWDQMRARLTGESGKPMLYFFSTCLDSIRTIPALQHDPNRPEDLDTNMEDHCLSADTKVITSKGVCSIKHLVGTAGKVLSINGFEEYHNCRMTKKSADVIKVMFDNGNEITCTPDHQFLTASGWIEAQNLRGKLCKSLSYRRQSKSLTGNHITNVAHTIREKALGYTGKFGNFLMGAFPWIALSTISTITERTTSHGTLNLSNTINIDHIIQNYLDMAKEPSRLQQNMLRSGTHQKRGESGILNIMISTLERKWPKGFRLFVAFVARIILSTRRKLKEPSGVATIVRHVLCVGAEDMKEKQDVYCMSVPATNAFAVEGGIIVHNCADECRYACMSSPWTNMLEPEPDRRRDYKEPEHEESWKTV